MLQSVLTEITEDDLTDEKQFMTHLKRNKDNQKQNFVLHRYHSVRFPQPNGTESQFVSLEEMSFAAL